MKDIVQKMKGKPQTGRTKTTYLAKDLFAEHIKNSHKSALRKQKLKYGQRFEQTPHQRKYMVANKYVERNSISRSLGKCKLKYNMIPLQSF